MGTNEIIFGRNPVKEALRANRVDSVFLTNSFSDKEILDLIKLHKITINKISVDQLDAKCKGKHQGIMAYVKPYEYLDLNELIRRSKKVEVPVIVMLDGINDPHNFGAIMRSCDIFNVSGIIISKHNQVPLNSTVAKTSAGAINYIPTTIVNNLSQTIDVLKQNGFWIIASDGSASMNYQDLKYDFPIVLVIGNEGDGVSKLVLKNSDYIIKIPQSGHINSLNASVAAGIILSRIRN